MMPFEYPNEESRRSLDRMWEDVWRLVEQLRLMEGRLAEEDAKKLADVNKRFAALERASGSRRTSSTGGGQHRIPIGRLDSSSTATVMTATVDGITRLEDGVAVYLTNGVITSAANFTLNINGLGARPVYQTMAAAGRVSTTFAAAYTMLFIYNESRVAGGCWDMYYGYDSNTNTLAYHVRTQQTSRKLGDRLSRYLFLFTQRDGTLVPSYTVASGNGTTGTTKTLNTGKAFDPTLPIFYYGTTTNVAAGNMPGGTYLWRQYSACEMRYAWNTGTTLTANTPVYVRCAPNADGTVQLDGNDCIVQALPSAEDGNVYIWLGVAYGTTGYNMELDLEHPVFEFKDGRLQRWA
jgi:hypothetical protein